MLRQLSDSVWWWVEMHGEARGEPYTWNSYAIHIPDGPALALVDPLPMTAEEVIQIEKLGPPTHILLTCEYHLRDSEACRDRWGCKILANEIEADRYEVELDGTFRADDRLWGAVDLIYLPDQCFPQTAFLVPDSGGILLVGDLLAGGRLDMRIPEGELAVIGPDYIPDLARARRSLGRLLNHDFGVLCPAHGHPVVDDPEGKLRAYLEDEEVWAKLEEEKRIKPDRRAE